jgi:hypothetical protein
VLMRTTKAGVDAVWVPPLVRNAILGTHHDHPLSGHLGIRKTTARVSQNYSWNGMQGDIRTYIKGCDVCQRVKPNNKAPRGMMNSRLSPAPGVSASCDLIGPLPKSPSGNEHALVIIDDFTKNFEIYPLKKATAKLVANKLIEYCCRYGFMSNLRSDQGPQFASHVWNTVCNEMGIAPRKIVAYRPQGNPTERANRTIKICIKAYAEEHRHWDKNLPAIAFAIRTAINETTKFTPAMLTFGHELRSPFNIPPPDPINDYLPNPHQTQDYAYKLKRQMAETIAEVQANCHKAQARQAKYYDRGRQPSNLAVGSWVLRKSHVLSDAAKGVTSSLSPLYVGPFRLSRKICDNVFEMENEDGEYAGTRNVDQLREFHRPPPWHEAPDEAESSDDNTDSDSMSEEEDSGETPDTYHQPNRNPHHLPDRIKLDERPQRVRHPPPKLRDYVLRTT